MLPFGHVAAASCSIHHSFAAPRSAWELHCNTAPQPHRSWPPPARLLQEVPSPSSRVLPNIAGLSFSLPTLPNAPLPWCFYSLPCNHHHQASLRAKARSGICRTGWLQHAEGKPETFPPPPHPVLATVTASDRRKPESTARLLGFHPSTGLSYTPCLDLPALASQDKAGCCSPAGNWF